MPVGSLSIIGSAGYVLILSPWNVNFLMFGRKAAIDRVALPNPESLKDLAIGETESLRTKIIEVSESIHSNPELGLKEYKASELLSSQLQKHGFIVEREIAGMSTAFRATLSVGHGERTRYNKSENNQTTCQDSDAKPRTLTVT